MQIRDSDVRTWQLKFNAPVPRARSKRAKVVARWFGLVLPESEKNATAVVAPRVEALLPAAGEVLLITGPSGAGKSSLLRALCEGLGENRWIDLNGMELADAPVVDCFGDLPIERALEALSRVGLAEAWTYLRKPCELSDGQRWRLRLALGLSGALTAPVEPRGAAERFGGATEALRCASRLNARSTLICDEFCAVLDRVSACVVARSLRRAITRDARIGAIVATSHDDLLVALNPDVHVRCDFGSAQVERFT